MQFTYITWLCLFCPFKYMEFVSSRGTAATALATLLQRATTMNQPLKVESEHVSCFLRTWNQWFLNKKKRYLLLLLYTKVNVQHLNCIWFHPSRKFQIQKTNMMLQGNHQRKHHLYGRGKPLQAIPSGIATRSLGWDPWGFPRHSLLWFGENPKDSMCLNDSSNPCTTYYIQICTTNSDFRENKTSSSLWFPN